MSACRIVQVLVFMSIDRLQGAAFQMASLDQKLLPEFQVTNSTV